MKRKTGQVSVTPIIINEKLGDFFIDIAKLVFAGVVLSTLLDITSDKLLVLLLGIGATIGLMLLVLNFIKIKEVNNGSYLFSIIGIAILSYRERKYKKEHPEECN